MSTDELWVLEHKYDVFIDECFGAGRFRLGTAMDALVILHWGRNNEKTLAVEVDPMARKDLLPAFMKSEGLFYMTESDTRDISAEAYARLLGRCRVVEISGGVNFDKAAEICVGILNGETLSGQ